MAANVYNSQDKLICSQSAWSLDASMRFLNMQVAPACYCPASQEIGGSSVVVLNPPDPGELQNYYTTVHSNLGDIYTNITCSFTGTFFANGTLLVSDRDSPGSGPIYNRRHTLSSLFSFSPSSGMNIHQTQSIQMKNIDGYNEASPLTQSHPMGAPQLYGGTALWESNKLADCLGSYPLVVSSSQQGLVTRLRETIDPSYNDYEGYSEDIRPSNKDFSIIPEFRLSEWLEHYLIENRGDFLVPNPSEFTIPGVTGNDKMWIPGTNNEAIEIEAKNIQNSSQNNFYKIYSNSDFMNHFERVQSDHKDFVDPTTIKLTCKVLMKMIPYDGFYPSERSLQIAHLAKRAIAPNLIQTLDTDPGYLTYGFWTDALMNVSSNVYNEAVAFKNRPFFSTLFGPGLLYNTIKAGMAVDYPIYTSSFGIVNYTTAVSGAAPDVTGTQVFALGTSSGTGMAGFDYRIPFEALLEPQNYLANKEIFDMEPNPDAGYNYGFYNRSLAGMPSGIPGPGGIVGNPQGWKNYPTSASHWISLSNTWDGTRENDLYERAINNYLAAIPEFFLQDGEFSSLQSEKEENFQTVTSGNYYAMRVKLYRSMNHIRWWGTPENPAEKFIDWDMPQDPIHRASTLRETFTLYSRPSAFGPPLAGAGGFEGGEHWPTKGGALRTHNYGRKLSDSTQGLYSAFTPAYKDGEGWADIIFRPKRTGRPTIAEIEDNSMVILQRIDPLLCGDQALVHPSTWTPTGETVNNLTLPYVYPPPSAFNNWYLFGRGSQGGARQIAIWGSPSGAAGAVSIEGNWGADRYPMDGLCANSYAMQINASVNLFGRKDDRWTIQTKFETPHYNFNHIKSSQGSTTTSSLVPNTLLIPTHGSESVPRGMWHQFGVIDDQRGIYLEVDSIPERYREGRLNTHFVWDTFAGGHTPLGPPHWFPGATRWGSEEGPGITDPQGWFYGRDATMTPPPWQQTTDPGLHSLADVMGFKKKVRLGKTSHSRVISEAIVAVPFLERDGERKFFEIPRAHIAIASGDLSGTDAVSQAVSAVAATAQAVADGLEELAENDVLTEEQVGDAVAQGAANAGANTVTDNVGFVQQPTILNMVNKMKKFIFPPRMDFLTYTDITPFAMYIFDFSYTLSQCDLAKIWQNVLPSIGEKVVYQEASIAHKLLSHELMGSFVGLHQESLKNEVQWMVFKVKQRANNKYFSKVVKYNTDEKRNTQYEKSYNWPYDYFSLVECAKIEATVGFGTELHNERKLPGPGGTEQVAPDGVSNLINVGVKSTRALQDPVGQLQAEDAGLTSEEKNQQRKERRKEKREEKNKKGAWGLTTKDDKDKS